MMFRIFTITPKLLILLSYLAYCIAQTTDSTVTTTKKNFIEKLSRGVKQEIADIKHPVESTITSGLSSQCSNVKKIVGVAYEQIEGEKEPDLNKLKLEFISHAYNLTYNINDAARLIPENPDFNPQQKLYIFCHGFTDDPSKASFSNISSALYSQGEYNVLALDGSALIHWLYLRSTTYVRFMGEKLGEVLAALVKHGANPDSIHVIGHSLGSHISSFAGKTFTNITGQKVGRITGLDPAGPCFSHIEDDLRLQETDASFVDVIHTDGGVFGLKEAVGQVDYYPNNGLQQPNCLFETCSHSRAWIYFTESVMNNEAFPAVNCKSWDAFKKGDCDYNDVSYMGVSSEPGTRGLYFLQTGEDSPYGLGEQGTKYTNNEGLVKNLFGKK